MASALTVTKGWMSQGAISDQHEIDHPCRSQANLGTNCEYSITDEIFHPFIYATSPYLEQITVL